MSAYANIVIRCDSHGCDRQLWGHGSIQTVRMMAGNRGWVRFGYDDDYCETHALSQIAKRRGAGRAARLRDFRSQAKEH